MPLFPSVTSSLPANLGTQKASPTPQLPSYNQCVPDGFTWSEGPGQGEELWGGAEEDGPMDENERIALQEAEDERMARELMQKEESEVRGRG